MLVCFQNLQTYVMYQILIIYFQIETFMSSEIIYTAEVLGRLGDFTNAVKFVTILQLRNLTNISFNTKILFLNWNFWKWLISPFEPVFTILNFGKYSMSYILNNILKFITKKVFRKEYIWFFQAGLLWETFYLQSNVKWRINAKS